MNILVESSKPFERASADLQRSVAAHGFSVLHVHALSDTLASKGHPIDKQVAVMEVCNARIASQMLSRDPTISLALPCPAVPCRAVPCRAASRRGVRA